MRESYGLDSRIPSLAVLDSEPVSEDIWSNEDGVSIITQVYTCGAMLIPLSLSKYHLYKELSVDLWPCHQCSPATFSAHNLLEVRMFAEFSRFCDFWDLLSLMLGNIHL